MNLLFRGQEATETCMEQPTDSGLRKEYKRGCLLAPCVFNQGSPPRCLSEAPDALGESSPVRERGQVPELRGQELEPLLQRGFQRPGLILPALAPSSGHKWADLAEANPAIYLVTRLPLDF